MANQKVRITQLPALDDGDSAVLPVNKNNVDYKFPVSRLLQSKNNLSEVDPEASRNNLDVYSKEEIDAQNKDTASGLREDLSREDGLKLLGSVSSFSELRSIVPEDDGQRIRLSSWNADTHPYGESSFGGGEFVAVSGNSTDDGGFVAKVSDNWHWKRVKDINEATVLDFGAIPDGQTDCHDAIVNMHNWAQLKTTRFFRSTPAIQFPAGSFYFTPVDFTESEYQHFVMRGPDVKYGYHALTVLTSNKSGTMIKTNARTVEISGLIVDGQNNNSANTQGFIDNTTGSITGGTYHRISNMWWQYFGGPLYKANDTLDTCFDQWYAQSCVGGGFIIRYDNATTGNWDHSTAVQLSNFNVQDCTTVAFFQMQRCLQSLMINGWIERSYGGDLTNGHWNLVNLSVENCADYGALDLTNCRVVETATNQVASIIKRGYDQSTAWTTSFQPGQTFNNNYGMTTTGSLGALWHTTPQYIRNNTDKGAWYRIGKIYLSDSGDAVQIHCVGEAGYNNAASESSQTYQAGFGTTFISIKKQANYYHRGQFFSIGNGAVQDVAVLGGANQSTYIYVYVAPYSKVGIYLWSNVAGSNEMTLLSGSRVSTTMSWQPDMVPSALSSLPTGYEKLPSRVSFNTTSADNATYGGIGISSDGALEVRTKNLQSYTLTGNCSVTVNGTPYSGTTTCTVQGTPVWVNGASHLLISVIK